MRSSIKITAALVCATLIVGCGGPLKYTLRGSDNATGADAQVVAKVNKGEGNTRLDIHATNLPPADRLRPGSTAFVVWQRKNQGVNWSRVGTLNYDPASREGTLREVSVPETAFDLQVTPENEAAPGSPSNQPVFSQRVEK